MNLYIIDPETKQPEKVRNLEEALKQAKEFKEWGSDEDLFEKKRRTYWREVYKRLLKLKKNKSLVEAIYCGEFLEWIKERALSAYKERKELEFSLLFFLKTVEENEIKLIIEQLDIPEAQNKPLEKLTNLIIEKLNVNFKN